MSATRLLDRLSGVRQTGHGRWLAKCPCHEDKRASLSVRELDDGRVLIHDFAGCSSADVLDALGLTMGDLVPERLGDFVPTKSRVPAGDVLAALSREADVVALIAADFLDKREITEETWKRLAVAVARLGKGATYVR
jgi:hypothetical protein